MATTGPVKGNLLIVYMDDNDGTGLRSIACSTNATFNGSNEILETTCKDNDGAKTRLASGQDWSMSSTGIVKYDADRGIEDLVDAWLNQTEVTVRFSTNVTGDFYLQGNAIIDSLSMDSPLNGISTWNVNFVSTDGAITKSDET